MAAGINSLKNTLENLKKYIESTFTQEIINKLSKDISKMSEFANTVNETGLVHAMNTFFTEANINDIANQLGIAASDVSKIVGDLNQTKVIEKFNNLLMQIHSYEDMLGLQDFLAKHGKYIPYLIAAGSVWSAILPIALHYISSKNGIDKKFQASCKERLDMIAVTSMQTMKFSAGQFLLQYGSAQNQNAILQEDERRMAGLAREARHLVDFTPQLNMELIQKFSIKLINDLYVDAGSDPLDNVTAELSPGIIDLAARNQPNVELAYNGKLNYSMVNRLYGPIEVDSVMGDVQATFQEIGNNIYYGLRNSLQSREREFSQIMQRIASAASNSTDLDNTQEAAFVKKIMAGKELIKKRLAHLPDEAVLIILNRAVLGYCQQTAQYFEFPWKVKEEVFAGLSDTAEIFSSDGLSTVFNKKCDISERPVRVITHGTTTMFAMAVSAAYLAGKIYASMKSEDTSASQSTPTNRL